MDFSYALTKNIISKDNINLLCKHIEENYVMEESEEMKSRTATKKANVKIIGYKDVEKYIADSVLEALSINRYSCGYDLYNLEKDHSVNYTTYDSNNQGEYGWHSDSSRNAFFDIKLTLIINISQEDYQGGEFKLFDGGEVEINNFRPGDLLLIKSHINHKVNPVISGKRKTLVMFLIGPKIR